MPAPTATASPPTVGAQLSRQKHQDRLKKKPGLNQNNPDISDWFKKQFNQEDGEESSDSSNQPAASKNYYQQMAEYGPETSWLADTNSNTVDSEEDENEEKEAPAKKTSKKTTGEKLKDAKEVTKGQAEKAAGKSLKAGGKAAKKAGGAAGGAAGKAGGWLAGGAVGATGGAVAGGVAGLAAGGVGAIPGAMAGAAEGAAQGAKAGGEIGGKAGKAIGEAPGAAAEKGGEALENQGQRTFNKGVNGLKGGVSANSKIGQESQLERAKNATAKMAKGDLAGAIEDVGTIAAKKATAGTLTGLWSGVWFDFTLMTLLSLHGYLFASLIKSEMAQFGEDYLFGSMIPDKQFAKWSEVLLLFVIDVLIIAVVVTIITIMWAVVTYIKDHSWSAAYHYGWGWLFGGGGLTAVFHAAIQSTSK